MKKKLKENTKKRLENLGKRGKILVGGDIEHMCMYIYL